MNPDLRILLRNNPVIALVGATNDETKYGNRILKDLHAKGYVVVPINPRAKNVAGIPAYPNLTEAVTDHPIGLVVYVVPPKYTLETLQEARRLGLHHAWIQPGAGDDAVRDFLDQNQFEYIMNACVMIESRI